MCPIIVFLIQKGALSYAICGTSIRIPVLQIVNISQKCLNECIKPPFTKEWSNDSIVYLFVYISQCIVEHYSRFFLVSLERSRLRSCSLIVLTCKISFKSFCCEITFVVSSCFMFIDAGNLKNTSA